MLIDSYRPISLQPSVSNVFEKVVFNQLYTYLTSNNLFYKGQYGFREDHSTEMFTRTGVQNNNEIILYELQYLVKSGVALDGINSYQTNRTRYVELYLYIINQAIYHHRRVPGSSWPNFCF